MALERQNSSQEEPETLGQVGHLGRGGAGIYQRLERLDHGFERGHWKIQCMTSPSEVLFKSTDVLISSEGH